MRLAHTIPPGLAVALTILAAVEPVRAGGLLDVTLAELWGIQSYGRLGTYPDGVSGFSAATTACNTGDVEVPWNAAMEETHPFIGLAMFRERDGILEMIGENWIKHGFYALSFDACSLGCAATDGSSLGIGCSDTYWASHNADRYHLGPREEVNPYTGEWTACGSFFDAEPVDCERDYFGAEPDQVSHRLVVHDSDLGLLNSDGTKARYFYEGVYITAGDQVPENDVGWRECTPTWNGVDWYVPTFPGLVPQPGPLVLSWGDGQSVAQVAPDDGEVVVAWKVEDLGGTWHYEYALYNRRSGRGVRSFSVPVGDAVVTNPAFRDVDRDPVTDWAVEVSGGAITWSTDDWAVDPHAPYLPYQTLFNFRFDADAGPVPATAAGGIFEPGIGSTFALAVAAPHDGVTAAPTVAFPSRGITSLAIEPNPLVPGGRIRYSLAVPGAVRLSVVDVRGRTVRTLLGGPSAAGTHSIPWDGRSSAGTVLASGVYFFRLEHGDEVRTVKAALVR